MTIEQYASEKGYKGNIEDLLKNTILIRNYEKEYPPMKRLSIEQDISRQGYKDNSPYKNAEELIINSPSGKITMDGVGKSLMVESNTGQQTILPRNSGTHQLQGTQFKEKPIMQDGGNKPNIYSEKTIKETKEWFNSLTKEQKEAVNSFSKFNNGLQIFNTGKDLHDAKDTFQNGGKINNNMKTDEYSNGGTNSELFKAWYTRYSSATGNSPNPYEKEHYYDYESFFNDNITNPSTLYPINTTNWHLPSKYKLKGHPRTYEYVDGSFGAEYKEGAKDTRTSTFQNGGEYNKRLKL